MKPFFGCIAIATEAKNGEIRVQNAKFAGKGTTQDEFNKTELMLDFYLIRDEQTEPDYPEQANLEFVGAIDLKTYERLISKGVIDKRFDPYSDFRWNSQLIDQILDGKGEEEDADFEKLNDILRKAKETNNGLIAYCD